MKKNLFETEQNGDVFLLCPLHNVSSLADADLMGEMSRLCAQLAQSDMQRVVVDFSNVDYFGSLMLEALRMLWNSIPGAEGRMALCNVSPVGKEILEIARFDQLWPVLESRDEAVRAVRG